MSWKEFRNFSTSPTKLLPFPGLICQILSLLPIKLFNDSKKILHLEKEKLLASTETYEHDSIAL